MGYRIKGDVEWFLPNKKRRFAYSTIATSDSIVLLSEMFITVNDVYQNLNYNEDAKKIVKHFIDNGYGDFVMYDLVHINKDRVYRKVMEDGTIKKVPVSELKKNLDIVALEDDNIFIL